MNVATSLDTEQDSKVHDLITLSPVKSGNKVTDIKVNIDDN